MATAKTAPALSFDETAPVTKAGRPAEPNPFAAAVAGLAESWDDAENRSTKGLRCTVPTSDVSKTRRRITEAAHALTPQRSPRITVTASEKEGTSVVTFSLAAKISRNGKDGKTETE